MFNTAAFQEKIDSIAKPFIDQFRKINRNHFFFHALFLFLLSLQFLLFSLLFSRFLQSMVMAVWLAGFFLTLFTYLVLLFYLQGRRPERLLQLRDAYIETVQSSIPFDPGTLEYHCCITEAIVHLTRHLTILPLKNRFAYASETLSYLGEKFRIWSQWKSLLQLKEMLFLSSIEEHIRLIKSTPTDLEAHASLASNYVALAALYQDPKKLALNEHLVWTPPEYLSDAMRTQFEMALERALEEYQIIGEYAPLDPWVHAQKASIYRELERVEDEQKEYEQILSIDPNNRQILFRLGKLYFLQGEHAKGLMIYEQLLKIDAELAQGIIAFYDAAPLEAYSFNRT